MMEMTTNSFDKTNTAAAPDGNGPVYEDNEYYWDDYAESVINVSAVVCSLVFVLGVLGNGVVIWVTGFKMKKTITTVWYLNLAVADFIFAAFLPLSVAYMALGYHWPFGKFMCKMNTTVTFLNMFASVYILVVISVDRCVSVVWPIWVQNHRNVRKASCVSLGVWGVALILSVPYFFFMDTEEESNTENNNLCFSNFALSDDDETQSINQLRELRRQSMIITLFLMLFVVPFTVIVSCYAVIIHRLRRNRTLASKSSRPFKIIAAIIITFFLCWAPFHIIKIIELVIFTPDTKSETLVYVFVIGIPLATSLAYLNSCLNPLLYVFMSQEFKEAACKSILNVLESAFREEETHFHTDMKSMNTSHTKEESDLNTEV